MRMCSKCSVNLPDNAFRNVKQNLLSRRCRDCEAAAKRNAYALTKLGLRKCRGCLADAPSSDYEKGNSFCNSCRQEKASQLVRLCKTCQMSKPIDEFRGRRHQICYPCRQEGKKEYTKSSQWAAWYDEYKQTDVFKESYKKRKAKEKTEEGAAKRRKQRNKRYSESPELRLIASLRAAVRRAFRGEQHEKRTLELLGCSRADLLRHLSSKFQPGMTMDNYGREWEIDHIIPLSSVMQQSTSEIAKALHWTNLQPLSARDNRKKGDLLPDGTRGRFVAPREVRAEGECQDDGDDDFGAVFDAWVNA